MKKTLIYGFTAISISFATAAVAGGVNAGINWGKGGISVGGGISFAMSNIHQSANNVVENCKEAGADHQGCKDAQAILDIAKKHVK